jgi:hypothetical protein
VEVDRGIEACPLCAAPIPRFDDLPPAGGASPEPRYPRVTDAGPARPTGRSIRLSVWATLSAIFVISMLVVLAVNLVWTGGSITWSGHALGSIALAWAISTVILVIFRPPWLVVLCIYPPVVGFLALVDLLVGSLDWFLPVGLPIATVMFLPFEVATVIWTTWKDRGANQLAVLLAMLGPACLAMDLAISRYVGLPGPTWSWVVVGVLVPLAGFLFVYHYVLHRVLKLDRIFHV